jgi:GH25 family lysozyme M1 (1,4-beta-N-acetylmuramidase)
MSTLSAIDVSMYQEAIDWGAVAASGIALAIAKATEGNGYTDPWWAVNQSALLAPGPLVGGSYHFARPDLGNAPQAEADWYLGRHDPRVFDPEVPWVFALDFEVAGGNDAWVRGFLDYLRGHIGYECWFYSSPSKITERGITPNSSPLWIAYYVPDPNQATPPSMGWPAVTMWQWGGTPVPGIAGSVDANIFYGDRQTLLTLAGKVGTPIPPVSPDAVPWRYRQMADAFTTRPDGTEDRFTVQPDGSGRHIATTANGTSLDVLPGVWSEFYYARWDAGIRHLTARGLGLPDGFVYEIYYSVDDGRWHGPARVAPAVG